MIPPMINRDCSEPRASRPALAIDDAVPAPAITTPQTDGVEVPALSSIDEIPALIAGTIDGPSQQAIPGVEARPRDGTRFLRDRATSIAHSRSSSQSPFRIPMPTISPGQLAFSALQYLPVPTLVLNNLKTVVLANEAMGRMLGIFSEDVDEIHASTTLERLRGQTLSQIGIDMLQDGRPVWVTWDAFLDNLVGEMGVRAAPSDPAQPGGDATPTTTAVPPLMHQRKPSSRPTQDAVVEVVISRKDIGKTNFDSRYRPKDSEHQAFAKMIISIWEIEDKQTFYTLTFTSTQSTTSPLVPAKKSIARQTLLDAAERKSISSSNPPSVASSRDSSSPAFHSPTAITLSSSPFPPMGPPSAASQSGTPSVLQKMIRMKDALLDNTKMATLAMWKDGSVTFPNKAARMMFRKDSDFDPSLDGFDLLLNWDMWNEDFTERLDVSQYPISILLRTEKPFGCIRVGMYDDEGNKRLFDVVGEDIRDDATGEFLAGVVTAQDVTEMTNEITEIKEQDEERFKQICETMPQLVWTATPDGMHDFFNTRWYSYTGLTEEECMGAGWKLPFHPDDLQECVPRWQHSLATGEPYVAEYRCRSKDGEWRWFLGRALAIRNKKTGEIEKWFGTCTDVHEGIQTKLEAKLTQQHLLSVIAHAHVTIFTADTNRRVTMLQGALIWDLASDHNQHDSKWFIGENVYTVFNKLTDQLAEGERPEFLRPIEQILDGRVAEDGVDEHSINNRWYRTRFLPMQGKRSLDDKNDKRGVEGVIGVIMDVTELRMQKVQASERLKEKRKAVANEAAAKEATRLKSQFLANMSHEIRTPIAGVLGMAELLGYMQLSDEQREYVENIHSSATSLLTVINDILDFSKVESGRLDIEEVQFSLSHIVQEVVKMLQFAVERKNLNFQSDISGDITKHMVVIGDPGRVRQIITNLLTNSIKFTNQGFVRFSVSKENETEDSVEIKFVVEDTGIGIQEEVRKKLFQPFSQGDASTARRFGGTGLGLTICKNLLELMRGRISLESRVGTGTIATFWIPFHKPHGQGNQEALASAGAIPDRLQSELSLSCNSSDYEQATGSPASEGLVMSSSFPLRRLSVRNSMHSDSELPRSERAKMHVLVVEDNAVNQKIATKSIGKLGFQVSATWNGKEALDYLAASSQGHNPKPDIILMDVQMPIIDGYKCTHLLRHHLPYKQLVQDVPIVAMTASAIQGDREKCTKAGMDDYLAKPVTMPMLEKMLVKWSISRRKAHLAPSASDCSETSEHCDTADIPQVSLSDGEGFLGDNANSPMTPRPLTSNGRDEPSPFDSPAAPELSQRVQRLEGEQEWSNRLQETKLIDAAGGPTSLRSHSFQDRSAGEALTEENMNRLRDENQKPHV